MSSEPDNIVLDLLREVRKDLGGLKQGQLQTNERLAAIEHHMAGFHVGLSRFNDDIDELRARLDRVERRLELSDDPGEGANT